jgi:DNA invertase Pin-like site-specific DNA recombinase
MAPRLDPPLTSRRDHALKVLGIARISTEHQDALSLEDQEALYRRCLGDHTQLPFDLKMIGGRGSGECLDRREALQATAEVETGSYDLVIAEDLGRIFRRIHAQLFCESCEDLGTRLIAVNDHVDTGRDDWRLSAFFATMRHEMYNADTSKRIRRSLRNRFQQGGVVQTTVYGYVKPPGAKTDGELHKDPAAQAVFDEVFRRLEDGAAYSEVADWLNAQGVKPGPYARSPRWTCSLVTQLVHNPILKGVRVRNRKVSTRVNQTGRRKSVAAPPGERLERAVPHLAFIEPDRYDRLIQTLDARNAKYRRKGVNGIDTRKDVPKKRTVWPGQHIDCGVCGRPYVYGGHGQKDHLMCRGAHAYHCWNAVTVDGPLAAHKLIAAIRREVAALPDFDPMLVQLVQDELRRGQESRGRHRQEIARRQAALDREIQNITAAIRESGHSPSLLDELQRLEWKKAEAVAQLDELTNVSRGGPRPPTLPPMAEIRAAAEQAFDRLATTSQEFGRLLRRLIPRIVVRPYRLCDGGHPVLRAHFTFSLVPLLPSAPGLEGVAAALERTLMVDLFDPPERAAHRAQVMAMTAAGATQRDIGRALGITQPAVQRAAALHRGMEALGVADPYLPLTEPPDDYRRLRRYRHPRYRFEPISPQNPTATAATD